MLEGILKVTYGCMIYQEQVMEIFRTLAGYSYGRADIVRRAMSKRSTMSWSANAIISYTDSSMRTVRSSARAR